MFLDEFNRCQESARNALMPALDSTRRVFHPIENTFIPIPDNVQFVAAVNRGREFSGTFGIDAAQLDRFAPLEMPTSSPSSRASNRTIVYASSVLIRMSSSASASKVSMRSPCSAARMWAKAASLAARQTATAVSTKSSRLRTRATLSRTSFAASSRLRSR